MIDPMLTRKYMYAKWPEGRRKDFPWINVFRFCVRNMKVSFLEETKTYDPSFLVQNEPISNLFLHAWDRSYRGTTGKERQQWVFVSRDVCGSKGSRLLGSVDR